MTLKRYRAHATYSTSTSDQDIDAQRDKFVADAVALGISGYFILGEGETWVHLEGGEDNIAKMGHELADLSFFNTYDDLELTTISSVSLNEVYTYHEGRTPITSE